MAGYTRQDTANNIANGNVIDADDFDAEYNAIEGAFNSTSGHTHDGTSGGGAPITKVGPAQDLIVSGTAVLPKTTNTLDLGSAGVQYKNAFFDGLLNTDTLSVDENATVSGTLGVTGNTTVGGTLGVTGNTTVGGTLGVTGQITGDLTGDVTGTVSSLSNHSTTDLLEGTNLYFTDARAAAAISVTDNGGDGSLTKSGGTITYTGPSATETRAHFSASNSGTGYGSLSYSAGVFTYTKVTDADIRGRLSASSGINYNSSTGAITGADAGYATKGVSYFNSADFSVASGYVSLSTERVQDIVGAMVSSNTESGIDVTYQDTDGTLDFSLSTEYIQDIVGAMVSGNTESKISVTYDDTDGTLDFILVSNPSFVSVDVSGTVTASFVEAPTVRSDGLELKLGMSSGDEMKVTSAGVNVYNGLVVGNSTTTPTDNDIYATGQIEAVQGFKVGSWTVTETSGGALLFSDGTDLLMKLYPSTGNLQIAGTLSENVSISPV